MITVIVYVGTLEAHNGSALSRWSVWSANVADAIAIASFLASSREKIFPKRVIIEDNPASEIILDIEKRLARIVQQQARTAWSQLVGIHAPGVDAANIRYVKDMGRFREVGGAGEGNLSSVLEYYNSLSPGRLVILGTPGAGKTVLAIELQIKLLEFRDVNPGSPVPILVSAAGYNSRLSWPDWLSGHIAARFGVSVAVARELVGDGRILPLIDGIDEMDPAGSRKRARELVAELNAWIQGRNRAPVVVTCRHSEYDALMRDLDHATHVQMVPLTAQEEVDYLYSQFLDAAEFRAWEPILAVLLADPCGSAAAQLSTPWRLTLALAAVRDGADPHELLAFAAESQTEYSERVDQLLFNGYVPAAVRRYSGKRLTSGKVTRWLATLADCLAWQALDEGSPADFQLTGLLEQAGRSAVGFLYLGVLLALATMWLFAAIACLLISDVSLNLQLTLLRMGLDTTLMLLAIFSMSILWADMNERGPAGAGYDLPARIGPQDVIRNAAKNGRITGLIAAAIAFSAASSAISHAATADRFAAAAAAGVTTGLMAGFIFCGRTWANYRIAVIILAVQGACPWQFMKFLDWAQEAGILRLSGIAYQFRHLQLRDWLISRL